MSNINIPSNWRLTDTPQIKSSTQPIVLTTEPNILSASENMNRFKFDAYESNPSAVRASIGFSVLGAINFGEVLSLTGSSVSVDLTASATPTFNQFYTDNLASFDSRSRVAEAIALELQNSLAFSNLYNIYSEDIYIYIQAKDFGSEYNLVLTTSPINLLTLYTIFGTSKYAYEDLIDYSGFVDVFVSNNQYLYGSIVDRSNFDKVFSFDVPFTINNFNIDTHSITKNYVDVQLPVKKLNVGFNYKLLDNDAIANNETPILRPYYVIYGDTFRYIVNGDKKERLQGCSSLRWIQNSSQNLLNPYDLTQYVWNTSSSKSFKWLTDSKDYIPVDYSSHQYLQCINKFNQKATGSFRVEIECFFYDGTTYTFSFVEQLYNTLSNNVSFDVSPNVWDLEGIESSQGKLIDYYKVYLVWKQTIISPERVSEIKTYKLRRVCVDSKVNIIWFNKFGGWDSFEFTGTLTKERNRSYTEIKRNIPFDANTLDSVDYELNLTSSIKSRDLISVNSGLLDTTHYEWLKDISLSSSIFVWNPSLSKYSSIVLESSDYNFNSDNTEFNLKITFRSVDNNTISR
jgi:hypothetical protein